jgi:hypothetical protein
VAEGWRDGCPAAGMPAQAICSGDWFAQIFTTKARRHKEKPETPSQQRPFLNRRFRRWRRCPEGGKIKLVGGGTTRTIAAKRDGTEAFPPSQAAGPRIRGDRLRSFGIISDFSGRRFIGRAEFTEGAETGLLNAEIGLGLMHSISGWRTLCSCTKNWNIQLGWGDSQNGQSFAIRGRRTADRQELTSWRTVHHDCFLGKSQGHVSRAKEGQSARNKALGIPAIECFSFAHRTARGEHILTGIAGNRGVGLVQNQCSHAPPRSTRIRVRQDIRMAGPQGEDLILTKIAASRLRGFV